MLQWQSAWRLLIATLVFAMPWPASAQASDVDAEADEVLSADDASQPAEAGSEKGKKNKKKRRDPTDWGDWRNYRPSAAGAVGITWDKADSSLDGSVKYQLSQPTLPCIFEPVSGVFTAANCERNSNTFDGFFQGGAFYIDGRVDLPEFDVASRPRLFVATSFVVQNQKVKALARSGFPSSTWESSASFLGQTFPGPISAPPFLRLEQTVDPESLLFVGVGSSFLLPVDSYPIRVNVSANYYRSKSTVGAFIDWAEGLNTNSTSGLIDVSQEMITKGVAVGTGVDVEIGQVGPVTCGFFSNTFVGFPLGGNDFDNTLFGGFRGFLPEEGFNTFTYERGVNISVFAGLRFGFGKD